MSSFVVHPIPHVKGEIFLPGDKSIAHRCAILGSLSGGRTVVDNFPLNNDCISTIKILQKLGVSIKIKPGVNFSGRVIISGPGFLRLKRPVSPLFLPESGTTLRLMLGVLAGQGFKTILKAGEALNKRPMLRVTAPLRQMGAQIKARRVIRGSNAEEYPPIIISGGKLLPIIYELPVASAQVKSALLLAGLYAGGETRIIEPVITRDHTERMLRLFGADITVKAPVAGAASRKSKPAKGRIISIKGQKELVSPGRLYVPGDISSASFFMVLAAFLPGSSVVIRNVSLNPTRSAIIDVLKRMNAAIRIKRCGKEKKSQTEPMGDVFVKGGPLKGIVVEHRQIPMLIDELPVLMVAACFAKGKTVFKGVKELRVKETDRIASMCSNLKAMGADIGVKKNNSSEDIIIRGVKQLQGVRVKSYSDHRTAMSMIIAGLKAQGPTYIDDTKCIDKSFPGFLEILDKLVNPKKIRK